jgi:cytochrome c oxidase subunit 4
VQHKESKHVESYRLIRNVFLVLLVLTLVEIGVAVYLESGVLLMLISLLKAGLVVYYFMHIYRLWRQEEHS